MNTAAQAQVIAALAASAAAGPFFVLDVDPPPATSAPGSPPWRPFTELTGDVECTRARVAAIRAGIAERGGLAVDEVPARAAASLAHLGLVARLVSPPLGAALLGGVLPDLSGALYWRDVLGPVPLTLLDPRGHTVDPSDTAAIATAVAGALTDGPVARLGAAIGTVAGVSEQVLWGNVASATAGALRMLGVAVPDRAAAAHEVAVRLLARSPLAGTGAFTPAGFRRRSCCLYYQVPGGGLCGDCVLLDRAERPPPR